MIRYIISFCPFAICLGWFLAFVWHYASLDVAKRYLTGFLAVCVTLYFCHALYFTVGLSLSMESLWALCSLSVYPLYFIYICELTDHPLSVRDKVLCLVPGVVVATLHLLFPSEVTDNLRKMLNAVQIFTVLYHGYNRLQAFDREVAELYADTEERDTREVKHLLVAFVCTSLVSVVANVVGKQFFGTSNLLLLLVLLSFAVLLFSLSYIGYNRRFTKEQFLADRNESEELMMTTGPIAEEAGKDTEEAKDADEAKTETDSELGRKIDKLILEDRIYLQPNLKITDVVREVGACRTYVSNYINEKSGRSFSDCINHLRIEYAKKLILEKGGRKLNSIGEASGFTSEVSFYRNFKKFEGVTPNEWAKANQII